MKDAPRDPLIGQVLLGKLDVIRSLGAGGMGSVYEVEHLITHHRRALKIIRPELVKRRTYMKRLIREAGVAGTLNTPYVVDTYDAGTLDDGSVYILMELLEGESLFDVIVREAELTVPRMIAIVSQICEGVGVAHRAGIIHRDLKPDNVFLIAGPGGTERVKIMDFGISKFEDPDDEVSRLTSEGVVLGTPFYMSPEQARGRELDPRSDLYSVGVMMYEALTGRLPFEDSSVGALFIKIAAGEYVPLRHLRPDVPEELAAVVERAMHRKREARYASMEELRASLLPFANVEAKVRAKTLSEHPLPMPRSTAAYEDGPGGIRHSEAAPRDPKSPPDSLAPPPSRRSYPSGIHTSEIPPAPSDEVVAQPKSRLMPIVLGVALLGLVGLGAAIALRDGSDEATQVERPRDEPQQPEVSVEEPESPTAPAMEPEERVAEPEVAPSMEEAPTPATMNGTMRRRAPTPAERAGLELSPYGPSGQ